MDFILFYFLTEFGTCEREIVRLGMGGGLSNAPLYLSVRLVMILPRMRKRKGVRVSGIPVPSISVCARCILRLANEYGVLVESKS